eukprot:SAG22_NODE_6620_length_831_cov_0.627049_1_plen_194_part_10
MTASRDESVLPDAASPPSLLEAVQPWTVWTTPAERAAGTLSPENVAHAVAGLEQDGVIVLKGVMDLEHVSVLRDRVLSDIAKYETEAAADKIEQGGVGWWHNWQGGRPPPMHPYLFDDFCYNEFVIAAVTAAVRPHVPAGWDGQLSGGYGLINMAFKGDMMQECHTDGGSLPIDPAATQADLAGGRPTGFSVNF